MGKVAKSVSRAVRSVGRAIRKVAKGVTRSVAKVFGVGGQKIEMPEPPAPEAPEPEQTTQDEIRPENLRKRRRKGRASLRIDLNTGGGEAGSGVNVPRG